MGYIHLCKANMDLHIKEEIETNSKYGMPPNERSLEQHLRLGLVNLDKPPNPSSHEVVSWVKKIIGVSHAGHGGTLEAQ